MWTYLTYIRAYLHVKMSGKSNYGFSELLVHFLFVYSIVFKEALSHGGFFKGHCKGVEGHLCHNYLPGVLGGLTVRVLCWCRHMLIVTSYFLLLYLCRGTDWDSFTCLPPTRAHYH